MQVKPNIWVPSILTHFRFAALFLLAAVAIASVAGCHRAPSADVVATVNGKDIKRSDLDLAYQQVLMFRNCKNGQLNVVYRRVDGHVGWIDPG